MKNIFIDGRPIRPPYSGVAQYTARLYSNMNSTEMNVRLVTAGVAKDSFLEHLGLANDSNWINLDMSRKIWTALLRYAPMGGIYLPEIANSSLIHITHFETFPKSLNPRIKRVLTVHDMIFKENPEWFTKRNLHASNISWQYLLKKRVDLILTPSKFTQDKIREFGYRGEIQITPLASTITKSLPNLVQRNRSSAENSKPYVLFLGNLEPRKGITLLLNAWRNSKLSKDYRLIIAGGTAYLSESITSQLKIMQSYGEDIIHLGFVDEIDKRTLLQGATFFCYPSLSEGFGIPVLDAMSLGIPVLTSRAGSLPEVCGDAAEMITPNDLDELTNVLQSLAFNQSRLNELSKAGIARSRLYSWTRTANLTKEAYKNILGI
jgi:glycosyltransferase involved in cell wall biosynthesis